MSTFDHNGTQIELLSNGKFQATINGVKITGGSLAGLKAKIDNAGKADFKPFIALTEMRYGKGELRPVEVLGVRAPRKGSVSYKDHHEFILKDETRQQVLEDSAENRAAWQAWRDYQAETSRIDEKRKAESRSLREKLKYLSADDYAPKKAAQ